YGYNFVDEILEGEKSLELKKYIKMDLDGSYQVSAAYLYSNMLNAEITARDREQLLCAAAQIGTVALYSASKFPNHGIQERGIIDYEKGMPYVFRHSRINLNITLRSITSGIPLRAMDIMGAGGFLMSNYQPELAEYFVDGQELVLFDSVQDMQWKLDYYLKHEDERRQIAKCGYEKVKRNFSYDVQLRKMINWSFKD
ncbi:MAG: glycosyltransferase, partial [Roseburia sp.]|nr:glycosyltransferase [Roseburia sp.]